MVLCRRTFQTQSSIRSSSFAHKLPNFSPHAGSRVNVVIFAFSIHSLLGATQFVLLCSLFCLPPTFRSSLLHCLAVDSVFPVLQLQLCSLTKLDLSNDCNPFQLVVSPTFLIASRHPFLLKTPFSNSTVAVLFLPPCYSFG